MTFCIICSRMYQDKLASLKRQLQQLHEGNHCSHMCCSNISCSAICFVVPSCWLRNTGGMWKAVMCIYVFLRNYFCFVVYRDPAGIPKEDEKAGPAVQREASKCRQAKKILSALSYWCIHADVICSLSLWAGHFCSFAFMGQRINRAPT